MHGLTPRKLSHLSIPSDIPQPDARSRLRAHPFLSCISERVPDALNYPFVGHEHLLDQTLLSISRGDSVLIVGEPGIGKRTLSLGLARRLAHLCQIRGPNPVYSRTVYALNLRESFLSAPHAYAHDVQETIRDVFRLVEEAGPERIVFCIDDIDILSFIDRLAREQPSTQSSSDGVLSTENMLRYLLFSKKVLCLCTCIKSAYQRLKESDTYYDEKFTDTFRVLHMQPPSPSHTRAILFEHKRRLEEQQRVLLPDDTIIAAQAFARRYISHRAMPEKAIDLLHQASDAAVCELRQEHSEADSIVVERIYVDKLIRKWCLVGEEQLQECLHDESLQS